MLRLPAYRQQGMIVQLLALLGFWVQLCEAIKQL
jgi:hypothetical protein